MGTYVEAAPASRTPWIARVVITVALIGTLALGVGFAIGRSLDGSPIESSGGAVTRVHPGYGVGYPLHGGLAGPSRVDGDHAQHPGYGAGYPLHGGLAGPSRVNGD